jgi:hypothetical protein
MEIFAWKGKLDAGFLSAVKNANAKRIMELGAEARAEEPVGRRIL